jgi:hypothetical protein
VKLVVEAYVPKKLVAVSAVVDAFVMVPLLAEKAVVEALVMVPLLAESAVEEAYGMVVAPVREKKLEVASAVGTPEAPVTLAKMEFAAMAVRPAAPAVYVRPLVKVVVAELNFEKKAEVRQPKTEAEAVSQVTAPEAYVRPVEKVVVAPPTQVPPERMRICPSVPAKSEEVAMEAASPVAPVMLPRIELAETCARFANGKSPVTCVVRSIWPPRFENERQLPAIAQQPLVRFTPLANEEVASDPE